MITDINLTSQFLIASIHVHDFFLRKLIKHIFIIKIYCLKYLLTDTFCIQRYEYVAKHSQNESIYYIYLFERYIISFTYALQIYITFFHIR